MLNFECPHCGQPVDTEATNVGREVTCQWSNCQRAVYIPDADPPPGYVAPPRVRSPRASQRPRREPTAVTVVIADRCHRCRVPIPKGEHWVREVLDGGCWEPVPFPPGRGRSCASRAFFCRRCVRVHDEQERQLREADSPWLYVVAIARTLVVLGVAAAVMLLFVNFGEPPQADEAKDRWHVPVVPPLHVDASPPRGDQVQSGKLELLSPFPVAEGVVAWVEVDGKRKAEWPVGARKVTLELSAGEHRVAVKSITDGSRLVVEDKRVAIESNGTALMLAGYDMVKPK